MENELQNKLISSAKYSLWFQNLPEHIVYEIQNNGFNLTHLIGKYNGYLDEDMENIPSLWVAAGLPVEELPNILNIYQKIINKFNEST